MNLSDQFLPGFGPSEKELIDYALAQPFEKKVARAVALLQEYGRKALEMSAEGYYLAFSGGKDSCVIKRLAAEAGVAFKAHYNNTTIDPPELIYYMREHHPDVIWENPKEPFFKRQERRPLPTRWARWCCSEYKECGGSGRLKVVGVRISESARRARIWREVSFMRTGAFVCPIAYWTDVDVWRFIRERGLPYCKLYDEGFHRLGCVGCPLASLENRVMNFKRWPRYEAFWRRSAGVYFREQKKRADIEKLFISKFGTFDEYWRWWMNTDDAVGGKDCLFAEQFLDITGSTGERLDGLTGQRS